MVTKWGKITITLKVINLNDVKRIGKQLTTCKSNEGTKSIILI